MLMVGTTVGGEATPKKDPDFNRSVKDSSTTTSNGQGRISTTNIKQEEQSILVKQEQHDHHPQHSISKNGLHNTPITPHDNLVTSNGFGAVGTTPGLPFQASQQQQQQQQQHPDFGSPTLVKSRGNFPAIGSTLGPYFCTGRLGKGTFCSIHKCINLHYFHDQRNFPGGGGDPCRVAAAKVEVGEFRNSGVLDGEAAVLQFLHCSLPAKTVPSYMGHYRGDDISALLMECLPGQDMHQLRDMATNGKSRRIAIQDAVYLTADVMLPLLRSMHQVGVVHRDVKPSNCVKRGSKTFSMVDFGLSKSIVVPKDSPAADLEHPWTGIDWIKPPNYTGEANFRKERETADFRGTSMYASLRVHQFKDYSPRDDVWSLLYVFCDLVSGGLPWMSHAANRDREACRRIKLRIHGEVEGVPDETEKLLMGHDYHIALFRKDKEAAESIFEEDDTLPAPLAMSKDDNRVQLLRTCFEHVARLSFWDEPDYDLIQRCLKGFLDGPLDDPNTVAPIDWQRITELEKHRPVRTDKYVDAPTWELVDYPDPLEEGIFDIDEMAVEPSSDEKLYGEDADLSRLPLELRFRIAQMDYNTAHPDTIAPILALRDWMKVAHHLIFEEWDTRAYEKGGHRSISDGYRRELYLRIIDKCFKNAEKFDNFCMDGLIADTFDTTSSKRRKVEYSDAPPKGSSGEIDLVAISRMFTQLRMAKIMEEKKAYAPPPRLSFG